MPAKPLNVYIGFDRTLGKKAAQVCAASLIRHSSLPINITLLEQGWLRRIGLYRRQVYVVDGQTYDTVDRRPFSTEFSFTRFLTPSLQPSGWAMFVDSDFMFRCDPAQMLDALDPRSACVVVRQNYQPSEETKMQGQLQQQYARKNWSSLCWWNCDHPSTRMLTPYLVNHEPGAWLHGFGWLRDDEIGGLDERWNWLEGHSSMDIDPAAVHYTRGTPDMEGWEDTPYSDEWREYLGD